MTSDTKADGRPIEEDHWIPVPEQDPMEITYDQEVNIWDPIEGEGFNEPGHWADVSDRRLPRLMEDGTVLLESNMRGVPTEGVQGSYTVADPDQECPQCGLPGIHTSVHTMAGVAYESCAHCDWSQER